MSLSPASSVRGGYPLGLAGAVAATRYVGATASGAPASGTFAVGDFAITQDGGLYICTVAGSPGTWAAVSGSGQTPTTGWIDDSAATWTRTANTTFTVVGDRTAIFTKGTRLRWTQTTVKYGTVIASSHAGGTTTVTIATTSDYVLTAAAISANSYSYVANPEGYPGVFAYTPTYTGFSAAPAGGATFTIVGRTVTVLHQPADGTSNAAGFTFTLPAPAVSRCSGLTRVINNGLSNIADPGLIQTTAASDIVDAFLTLGAASWTAANAKNTLFSFAYFI